MKKTIALLIAMLLLLATLAACGSSAADDSPPAAPPIDPPAYPAGLPVPLFLSQEEQELYRQARHAFESFEITLGFGSDGTGQSVEVDGRTYIQANGEYTTWDEFYDAMLNLFTPAYLEVLLADGAYIEHEGNLYYLPIPRALDPFYTGSDTFEEVSRTESRVEFNLIASYEDSARDPAVYTQSAPLVMEKTNDGWRFSLFALPY